jgi:hypothetical protein
LLILFLSQAPCGWGLCCCDRCIRIYETSVIQLASSRCNNSQIRINISIELPWKPQIICNTPSVVELMDLPQRNFEGRRIHKVGLSVNKANFIWSPTTPHRTIWQPFAILHSRHQCSQLCKRTCQSV